uniref:Secreted protein n=1 Tax=Ascaris lumbricoides TaxID=6252 RepID=A0A0M3IAC3_ASCLU
MLSILFELFLACLFPIALAFYFYRGCLCEIRCIVKDANGNDDKSSATEQSAMEERSPRKCFIPLRRLYSSFIPLAASDNSRQRPSCPYI